MSTRLQVTGDYSVKRKHEIHAVCDDCQPGVQPLGKLSLNYKCFLSVFMMCASSVAMLCCCAVFTFVAR